MSGIRNTIFFILAIVLVAGCSTSTLSGSWSDPSHEAGQLRNVAILAVSDQDIARRSFEESMANGIKTTGANATPSYNFIKGAKKLPKEAIRYELEIRNIDAVLVARVTEQRSETAVSPGYSVGSGYYGRSGWYGSYNHYHTTTYIPPQVYNYKVYTVDASLHALEGERLVWSARIESVPEGDMKKTIDDLVSVIIKDMQARKVF